MCSSCLEGGAEERHKERWDWAQAEWELRDDKTQGPQRSPRPLWSVQFSWNWLNNPFRTNDRHRTTPAGGCAMCVIFYSTYQEIRKEILPCVCCNFRLCFQLSWRRWSESRGMWGAPHGGGRAEEGLKHDYLATLNLTDPFGTNTNPVVLDN